MKTFSIKPSEIEKKWILLDAEGVVLGRLAAKIAIILRGKDKPTFTPHMDMGDFVVIVNAEKITVTGNKETEKTYFSHTGYPGGVKNKSLALVRKKNPERILMNAVKGMLPRNKLGRSILCHLKVYNGPEHPHAAQNPKNLEV